MNKKRELNEYQQNQFGIHILLISFGLHLITIFFLFYFKPNLKDLFLQRDNNQAADKPKILFQLDLDYEPEKEDTIKEIQSPTLSKYNIKEQGQQDLQKNKVQIFGSHHIGLAQPEIKILDPGNAITTEAPINKVNPEKQKQSKERAKLKKKLETVVKPTKKKNVILQSQSANRIIDKTINQYFSADIKSLQKRLGAQKIPDNLDQETMQKLEFMNEFMRNYHKILQSYLQQPGMLSEGSVIAIISYDYNGNLSFEKFVKSDNHFPQVKHIMQGSIENMEKLKKDYHYLFKLGVNKLFFAYYFSIEFLPRQVRYGHGFYELSN